MENATLPLYVPAPTVAGSKSARRNTTTLSPDPETTVAPVPGVTAPADLGEIAVPEDSSVENEINGSISMSPFENAVVFSWIDQVADAQGDDAPLTVSVTVASAGVYDVPSHCDSAKSIGELESTGTGAAALVLTDSVTVLVRVIPLSKSTFTEMRSSSDSTWQGIGKENENVRSTSELLSALAHVPSAAWLKEGRSPRGSHAAAGNSQEMTAFVPGAIGSEPALHASCQSSGTTVETWIVVRANSIWGFVSWSSRIVSAPSGLITFGAWIEIATE